MSAAWRRTRQSNRDLSARLARHNAPTPMVVVSVRGELVRSGREVFVESRVHVTLETALHVDRQRRCWITLDLSERPVAVEIPYSSAGSRGHCRCLIAADATPSVTRLTSRSSGRVGRARSASRVGNCAAPLSSRSVIPPGRWRSPPQRGSLHPVDVSVGRRSCLQARQRPSCFQAFNVGYGLPSAAVVSAARLRHSLRSVVAVAAIGVWVEQRVHGQLWTGGITSRSSGRVRGSVRLRRAAAVPRRSTPDPLDARDPWWTSLPSPSLTSSFVEFAPWLRWSSSLPRSSPVWLASDLDRVLLPVAGPRRRGSFARSV